MFAKKIKAEKHLRMKVLREALCRQDITSVIMLLQGWGRVRRFKAPMDIHSISELQTV